MRRFLLLLLLCIALVVTAGCTSRTQYVSPGDAPLDLRKDATATTIPREGQLQIVSHELEYTGSYTVAVVGIAKNVGGARLSHASVEAKFYDDQDNLLGNGMDMISDLDPGETWKFKCTYFSTDVAEVETYKIGVGSSW